jgi:hypothetical protein
MIWNLLENEDGLQLCANHPEMNRSTISHPAAKPASAGLY